MKTTIIVLIGLCLNMGLCMGQSVYQGSQAHFPCEDYIFDDAFYLKGFIEEPISGNIDKAMERARHRAAQLMSFQTESYVSGSTHPNVMISIHIAVEDSCLERECYEVKQNGQGENILYVVFRADKRKLPRFTYSESQRNLLYEKMAELRRFCEGL